MRKLVLSAWVSADGYFVEEGSELMSFMHALPEDEEQEQYGAEQFMTAGELAMGSSTYRSWAPFWPTSDLPTAARMNSIPKIVFTRGDELEATWGPTRVIRGEAVDALPALRAEDGGDIVVQGSMDLARNLLAARAFDEIRLLVLPVAAGAGTPLFGTWQPLRLVSTRAFTSGLQEVVWDVSHS